MLRRNDKVKNNPAKFAHMEMELKYLRLGHLGEVHLQEIGEDTENGKTMCGLNAKGPNFSEVSPVDLEPRPSPQLCPDCKDVYDERTTDEEEEE